MHVPTVDEMIGETLPEPKPAAPPGTPVEGKPNTIRIVLQSGR
jgi:hypothetical protein